MKKQNQIKSVLTDNIDYIRGLIESGDLHNRTQLASYICDQLELFDFLGNRQISGCLKALRELEDRGGINLPAPVNNKQPPSPRRLEYPVPLPENVPSAAGEVRNLSLIPVNTDEQMRIWNELMIQEHPQGAGPLVGRQIRYLISSDHGYLGGFGFAAPALQLADRDRWIGWDQVERKAYLHHIVCLSRFLLRPSIVCKNLASKVLSMSIQIMPNDFEKRYGYRPILIESFVDTSAYIGTVYQATNWINVGKTKGRGRQDKDKKAALSIKDIYIFPVDKDFRASMGLSPSAGLGPLEISAGLDASEWAKNEFGGAQFSDKRLAARLIDIAEAKALKPTCSVSEVFDGNWAATKAYYRFIDKPDESKISIESIMRPHRERTIRRMSDQRTVLCIQDGSDLTYTSLSKTTDLGVTGTNQTGACSKGLYLYSTLAVTTEGLPLGVLRAQCEAKQPKTEKEKKEAHLRPIEEKDTYCWIESLRDIHSISSVIPNTRLVSVCDREADYFEHFEEQKRIGRVELLVRAKHNRNIESSPYKLFDAVKETEVQETIKIKVPRQSYRPKLNGKKEKQAREARTATLSIRFTSVVLPNTKKGKGNEPIKVYLIHALEENCKSGDKPVEWFLLTSMKIESVEQAIEALRWYVLRWRIEDWHRVIKTGCRIEDLALKTAERLKRAIGINLVIGWRIMLMTLLGREMPELPADILFTDLEIKVLAAYSKKKITVQ